MLLRWSRFFSHSKNPSSVDFFRRLYDMVFFLLSLLLFSEIDDLLRRRQPPFFPPLPFFLCPYRPAPLPGNFCLRLPLDDTWSSPFSPAVPPLFSPHFLDTFFIIPLLIPVLDKFPEGRLLPSSSVSPRKDVLRPFPF